jgi:hypothetical protein
MAYEPEVIVRQAYRTAEGCSGTGRARVEAVTAVVQIMLTDRLNQLRSASATYPQFNGSRSCRNRI